MKEKDIKELQEKAEKLLQQVQYFKSDLDLLRMRYETISKENTKLKREVHNLKKEQQVNPNIEQRSFEYGNNK